MNQTLKHYNLPVAKMLDAKAEDAGWIEGYVATFGNVDSYGDVFVKGCFAEALESFDGVPLMATHFIYGGDSKDVIGTITEAKEDDRGLWIHADLARTQVAQDVRSLIIDGHVKNLSIGFAVLEFVMQAKDDAPDEMIRFIMKASFEEGTVTVKPVNREAGITSAKSKSEPEPKTKTSSDEPKPFDPDRTALDVDHQHADTTLTLLKGRHYNNE